MPPAPPDDPALAPPYSPARHALLVVRRADRPLRGTAPLVGDKSISHRILILAAVADGVTRIRNLSPCRDVQRTMDCLIALGVPIQHSADDPTTAVVHGVGIGGLGIAGLGEPPVTLDCGDSGTTMRLLAGLLAGQDRPFVLDGAPGLRARPMQRVVDPLSAMGAAIAAAGGRPPIRCAGHRPLRAIDLDLPHASAQVGSAILLAGLNAAGTTIVHYPTPVRDHTERMLAAMGAPIEWDGATTRLTGPVAALAPPADDAGGDGAALDDRVYTVPDDPSAAAFILAAAVLVPGSSVRLPGVGVNPGRMGFVDILRAMGARVVLEDPSFRAGEPVATITVEAGELRGVAVGADLVAQAIDELPLVAVLATQAQGRTVVTGASELRLKESDRIAAIAEGLSRLGARIDALPDGFVIDGPTPLLGTRVDGHDDHRIVMSLGMAGLAARGTTTVSDAWRVADSYPGFVSALRGLGADVRVGVHPWEPLPSSMSAGGQQ